MEEYDGKTNGQKTVKLENIRLVHIKTLFRNIFPDAFTIYTNWDHGKSCRKNW